MLLFNDVLRLIVRPLAIVVQSAAEPWVYASSEEGVNNAIKKFTENLRCVRRLSLVMALCAQHLNGTEWRPFLIAMRTCSWAKTFPSLLSALPDLVGEVPPKFQACQLRVLPEHLGSLDLCLGAHCQCHGFVDVLRAGLIRGGQKRVGVRVGRFPKVMVPHWVASRSGNRALRSRSVPSGCIMLHT